VATFNNFGASLWKQVQINVNGDKSNSLYAYGALLKTLLSYGSEANKTMFVMGLFYKDSAREMSNITMTPTSSTTTIATNQTIVKAEKHNSGLLHRRKIMLDGKGTIETVNQMHADLFKSERFLVDNSEIVIILTKNSD